MQCHNKRSKKKKKIMKCANYRTIKLSDQEFISLLINQSEGSEEDDNSEEANTPDEDLSISVVFNVAEILANYMILINKSAKTNFEELEKKIEYDFYTN
ncbi:Hypothetical protein CINCED_3A024003 [Cinara cedri]|uniref:Uncharacterized protein n=1 Tax=Cinara cedri TaxID=506608 RepID=A0A5E4MAD9_9HEMI|nr:Hypothetical protein CINCED_3A024003 [Cinara cedri]